MEINQTNKNVGDVNQSFGNCWPALEVKCSKCNEFGYRDGERCRDQHCDYGWIITPFGEAVKTFLERHDYVKRGDKL